MSSRVAAVLQRCKDHEDEAITLAWKTSARSRPQGRDVRRGTWRHTPVTTGYTLQGPGEHRVSHSPGRQKAGADPHPRRATHRLAGRWSAGRCHWRPACTLRVGTENSSRPILVYP